MIKQEDDMQECERERVRERERDCQSADQVKMTFIETGLVIYLKTDDDDDAALVILV